MQCEEAAEKSLAETQSSACEDTVRGGRLLVKERLLWRAKPSCALISGISLPNSWKTDFCYASFPVCILLWQPEHTNTDAPECRKLQNRILNFIFHLTS